LDHFIELINEVSSPVQRPSQNLGAFFFDDAEPWGVAPVDAVNPTMKVKLPGESVRIALEANL
jgi:hypothetical protein